MTDKWDELRAAKVALVRRVRDSAPTEMLTIDAFLERTILMHPNLTYLAGATEVHDLYAEYRYLCAGSKDYVIAQPLCTKLNSTNLRDVPAEFLRLPFNTIRLLIPHGTAHFEVLDEPPNAAREIFISEMFKTDLDSAKEKALFTNISRENPAGVSGIKIILRNKYNFSYFWIWLTHPEVHACVDASIAFAREQFSTEEKRELRREAYNAMNLDMPEELKAAFMKEVEHNMTFTPEREQYLRTQFEFILKCLLYINGANADVYWHDETLRLKAQLKRATSGKGRKHAEQELAKHAPHYRVGHNIVLSREEKAMYNNLATGKWKITAKFIVQGHFRNQPYGPGRAERKIIFIEPFYKGADYADELRGIHIVE